MSLQLEHSDCPAREDWPLGHGLHVAWFFTLAYLPSPHFSQVLSPTRRYPDKQEHPSNPPVDSSTPTVTMVASVQLQLSTDVDPADDLLREGQGWQATEPRGPSPYSFPAHSMQLLP
jgi:hypothetical protein